MRLVVTGALGHIGSRLIHTIRAGDFDEVVLVDNLSTQRYCSLFDLPPAVPFRLVEADVCTADLDAVFRGADVVVHLAAVTDASASVGNEELVEAVNFDGTVRVAQACARQGCRLLAMSTTSVYGVADGIVDEDCAVTELRPQSPYAASKLRAEQMLQAMGADAGLRFFIGRFATIYDTSVGMRFHTAINKFCWQASVGQAVTVWRTAMDQARPYLDLDDAVRAIRFVIKRGQFDGRIYNVLTQNATVRELIQLIREIVPDLGVVLVDSPIMNQLSYTVSAERFRSLGFAFHGDLRSGIQRTLALLWGLNPAHKSPLPAPTDGPRRELIL